MKRRKGGMAGILVLVMVIAVVLLGGMLMMVMFGSSNASSVAGTELETAGNVTETTITLGLQIFPVVIWLSVIAVIGLSLFFIIRITKRRR